jgi:hypothetical protein
MAAVISHENIARRIYRDVPWINKLTITYALCPPFSDKVTSCGDLLYLL